MSRSGLAGVTLGVLADLSVMSKSGLFAHFKSKDELQVALLEHAARLAYRNVLEPASSEPEGLPRLRAVVRNWLGWAPRSGLPGGCPVAAGMFEFDDVEGPAREKLLELESVWRGFLADLVCRAVELSHLRTDLDVEQFVWELGGIYLAHHASQRFARSPDSDWRAAKAFDSLVERSLGARTSAKETTVAGPNRAPRSRSR